MYTIASLRMMSVDQSSGRRVVWVAAAAVYDRSERKQREKECSQWGIGGYPTPDTTTTVIHANSTFNFPRIDVGIMILHFAGNRSNGGADWWLTSAARRRLRMVVTWLISKKREKDGGGCCWSEVGLGFDIHQNEREWQRVKFPCSLSNMSSIFQVWSSSTKCFST